MPVPLSSDCPGDPVDGEVCQGPLEERSAGRALLVVEDLGVSQPGVVVDDGVDVVVPTAERDRADVIVVDTSVLIDHLRGRAKARDVLLRAVSEGQVLAASVLTRVEVMAGVRSDERRATGTLFSVLQWLPVTEAIAEEAGLLARRYRGSHGAIDVVDYVVAASAQVHDAAVWTLNVKHFPMVEGIRAPY